jgi:photosystem II stability/assembly factor-like uncharacterized protein
MYVHWLDGMSVRGDAARLMYPHTTRRMALYRSVLAFCSSGLALVAFVVGVALSVTAQQVDPALLSNLQWRLVGPFRGGRAITATGVPGNPSVYYFGAVGGGVWKTTDAGVTWQPIFDAQPISSIGAVAVAPSNPDVIYVGSGEADMRSQIGYGNGMYKSTDGGKSWSRVGLADSRQIGKILVDPKDPNIVFVAALGHAYGANAERGVFKSTDGGQTWQAVLHKDDNTGAIDLAFDPQNSQTIYASLWQTRRPPWNVYPASNGPGSGLYKSTDGGANWTQLTKGVPTEGLGRIGVAVAPSEHDRVYAIVDAKDGGLYRSDNAGATWHRTDDEHRIWGRGWYFGVVAVDPKNPDLVYVSNTSMYRSTDGGKTFVSFKGAPGGDDYHSIWIAPEDGQRIIISSDQGTVISLNGGQTWSSWYNQPTAQLYHVATDKSYPYWIYGAQQDSGAIAVESRSKYASITERDWKGVSVGGESGMIAPDPSNANIVFGGGVSRYQADLSQDQDVSPTVGREGMWRQTWTLPIIFSPADPHKLYFSHQVLFRSSNGGQSWDEISPDLTREDAGVPANLDAITAKYGVDSPRKGVIYSIAPSPLDANLLWVGTDDGLIHRSTDDGKHWQNVTPAALTAWSKVAILEASHFDKQSAYAAVDRHRIEDYKAYLYRTRDGGKSWQSIANGFPDGAFANVVREDPVRRGLLYAGTEAGIYVSFDDGDHWQPLQMNLPNVSIRDIAFHGDDVVIATFGRSFWALDDVTALREVHASIVGEDAHLFKPQVATRTRPGNDEATPYPPEIPHGDNPPVGAIFDYYLKADAAAPITLEILNDKGESVRKFSSDHNSAPPDEKTLEYPAHWVKLATPLVPTRGAHRFVWDLHYELASGGGGYRRASGVWVLPGEYTAVLTVAGKSYKQPLTVRMDPRKKTSLADLERQFAVSQRAADAMKRVFAAAAKGTEIEKQLSGLTPSAADQAAVDAFRQHLTEVLGKADLGYGAASTPMDPDTTSLRHLSGKLRMVLYALQSADAAPTPDQEAALTHFEGTLAATEQQWNTLLTVDLPKLNEQLKQAGQKQISKIPDAPVEIEEGDNRD